MDERMENAKGRKKGMMLATGSPERQRALVSI